MLERPCREVVRLHSVFTFTDQWTLPFPSACQASVNFPDPTSHTYSTSTATTTTTASCHKKRRETTRPRITNPTVDSPKSLVRKKQNAVLAQTKLRLTSLAVVLLLHVLVEDLELLARLSNDICITPGCPCCFLIS